MSDPSRRIIIGLDLSLRSTGLAVVDSSGIYVHRITSKGREDASVADTAQRIGRIIHEVTDHVAGADLVVIEAPSFASVGGAQHERGGLWWGVVRALVGQGIPIATVTPQGRAKYATGRGNAGKDEVLAAVVRRYPHVDVTGNDVADALVLAAMGARFLDAPFDDVPKINLAAMSGARWPSMNAPCR